MLHFLLIWQFHCIQTELWYLGEYHHAKLHSGISIFISESHCIPFSFFLYCLILIQLSTTTQTNLAIYLNNCVDLNERLLQAKSK